MADYRDMAAALSGGYGQDTGGITPDTLITLKNGKKATASDLLGMLKGYGQAVGSNLESLGRGGLSQFLGSPVDTANTIRTPYPMEVFGDVNYTPDKQLPGGSADILGMMPRVTKPTPQAAGMEIMGGFMAPATAKVLKPAVVATGRMIGKEVNAGLTGQPTRSLLGDITPKPLMAVEPQMQMAQAITKPKAEVSPLGFYSAVEQQALNIPRKQGTGESFLNELAKGQDVKKYEMETMGLDEFLKNKPNVTRQEVQDYIANNRINVQEVQLSGKGEKYGVFSEFNPDTNKYHIYSNDARLQGIYNTAEEADAFVNQHNSQIPYGPSKYEKYQLPGGENYREILLTTPSQEKAELDVAQIAAGDLRRQTADLMEQWKAASELNPGDPAVVSLYQKVSESRKLRDQAEATAQELKNQIEAQTYRSSHFDEPNILAHMRVNDRVDADGKKMLLIEEIQSDWHQAGRERGYKGQTRSIKEIDKDLDSVVNELRSKPNVNYAPTEEDWARYPEITSKYEALSAERNLASKQNPDAVPDAPFKETWYQLALKRALKEAVDKGYDRIGLTTGKQQIDRFSNQLRQNVDEINFNPIGTQNEITVNAKKNGQNTFTGTIKDGKFIDGSAAGKTAEEVLGKTMAKQIAEKKDGVIKGDDLTIGGEGMKKYYDEVYPAFLNKQGKKYGAQVGETKVNTVKERADNSMIPTMGQEPVRYLDITPEMRKAIKEGQPLASIQDELAKALA